MTRHIQGTPEQIAASVDLHRMQSQPHMSADDMLQLRLLLQRINQEDGVGQVATDDDPDLTEQLARIC